MASVYVKGKRVWMKVKRDGRWVAKITPYVVGQEEDARRYANEVQRLIDADAPKEAGAPMTVRQYIEAYSAERERRGLESPLARMERYVLPAIGHILLSDLRTSHIRGLFRKLKDENPLGEPDSLAPKTIHHIRSALRKAMADAVMDELIAANPVVVAKEDMHPKVLKDPEWRSLATYSRGEVEMLISDPRIPADRRVIYALKALAGLRHGEAAGLSWRHIDTTYQPLGRMVIAKSFNSHTGKVKGTKTGDTRYVPIHPVLADILKVWRERDWKVIYGREPTPDDLVVPTVTFRSFDKGDVSAYIKEDLELLGLRVDAGQYRSRGGHDLRAFFITQSIEDGADSMMILRTTHKAPKTVTAGYFRPGWEPLCREVAKLRIDPAVGLLRLGDRLATLRSKVGKRWRPKARRDEGHVSGGRQASPWYRRGTDEQGNNVSG